MQRTASGRSFAVYIALLQESGNWPLIRHFSVATMKLPGVCSEE
jgi:hypothetical protein